jgi:sugar phosphate isomerase/epimerase
MKVCLKAPMVSYDAAARVRYCTELFIPAQQGSAKSIPAAAERGWPTVQELRDYKQLFDDAGIETIALEPVKEPLRTWVEDTPEGRESFEVFARHLDAAGEVGISTVTLHPPLDSARTPEEAAEQFERNCAFYERAAARAQEAGTKLATHSPYPERKGIWGVRQYEDLFRAVPNPANGMIFCSGCIRMAGDDPVEVAPRLLDRIFYVHVRDVIIRPGKDVEDRFPGTGQYNPASMIKRLWDLGYRGAITPEHTPRVFGEKTHEITTAFSVGWCRAVLEGLQ